MGGNAHRSRWSRPGLGRLTRPIPRGIRVGRIGHGRPPTTRTEAAQPGRSAGLARARGACVSSDSRSRSRGNDGHSCPHRPGVCCRRSRTRDTCNGSTAATGGDTSIRRRRVWSRSPGSSPRGCHSSRAGSASSVNSSSTHSPSGPPEKIPNRSGPSTPNRFAPRPRPKARPCSSLTVAFPRGNVYPGEVATRIRSALALRER